jgi:hypothetical protein
MSDLGDLHGIFPPSIRWNAEDGVLGIAIYNPETGERGVQPIDLGKSATFVLDIDTRERGYGRIRVNEYSMLLTPVGSPPPPYPGDGEEYKPALGCWLWNPHLGEVRLETNATMFRNAVDGTWRVARSDPLAAQGQSPVVCFTDRVEVPFAALRKSFWAPTIEIVNWLARASVPGWSNRAPTVAPPTAAPVLSSPAAPGINPKEVEPRRHKAKRPEAEPDGSQDPNDDLPPWT